MNGWHRVSQCPWEYPCPGGLLQVQLQSCGCHRAQWAPIVPQGRGEQRTWGSQGVSEGSRWAGLDSRFQWGYWWLAEGACGELRLG